MLIIQPIGDRPISEDQFGHGGYFSHSHVVTAGEVPVMTNAMSFYIHSVTPPSSQVSSPYHPGVRDSVIEMSSPEPLE